MSSSNPIFLDDPEQEVVLFGKTFTAQQIKDEIIDAKLLKGKLETLLGGK